MATLLQQFTSMTEKKNFQLAGIVQTFINNAPLAGVIDWANRPGFKVEFKRELTLPANVGFRVRDAEYTAGYGETIEVSEDFKIAGGKLLVDGATIKQSDPQAIANEKIMKAKALARAFNTSMFKGDGTSGTLTGLQARIGGSETILNHATAGPLSIAALREAVLECRGITHILMGKRTYLRFWTAQNAGVGMSPISFMPNEYGMRTMFFDGVPVIMAGEKTDRSEILDFTETSSTTSIYLISNEKGAGVQGFQNSEMSFTDQNQISTSSAVQLEWIANFMIQDLKTAIRLKNITDAAVIA